MTDGQDRKEGRRLLRRAADLCATITGSSVRPRDVTIIDLTGYGCRVKGAFRSNVGERLLLTIDPIGPMAGTVIWWADGELGLEFIRPLHPAVIDHIRQANVGPARSPDTGARALRDYPA